MIGELAIPARLALRVRFLRTARICRYLLTLLAPAVSWCANLLDRVLYGAFC